MTVDRARARHLAEHDGTIYAFCSIGCRTRFVREPAVFLAAPGTHSMEATSGGWLAGASPPPSVGESRLDGEGASSQHEAREQ
jgi:Cu+-exporting ATPase